MNIENGDVRLFVKKIVNQIKMKFPPDRNWKYQKQTDPPSFGWANLVSDEVLAGEINKRRDKCCEIIEHGEQYCGFKKGKVSMVVLSCRRWWTLKRLLESLNPFFNGIEDYPFLEKILVDNASGDELINKVKSYNFFDNLVCHQENLGMVGALKDIFEKVDGEYILFCEDDFVFEYDKPFIQKCINIFDQYPEIGIIRLKNQNNWWKPFRVIAPERTSVDGTSFWTWIPSKDKKKNVWCAGSVMFRRVSYFATGPLPDIPHVTRTAKFDHATVYEYEYGIKYNENWLAAKVKHCTPFVQPNDNDQSPGWE